MSIENALVNKKTTISLPLDGKTVSIADLKSKEFDITRVEVLRAAVLYSFDSKEFWMELKKLCK